jgi:YVTN family beta-propeller protein
VYLLNGETVKAKAKVGYRPYGAALSPDGTTLAVSEWGNRSVALLDAQSLALKTQVTVGSHPTALAYAPDGRLFVSNAGSTSVSVLKNGAVVETIEVGVDAARRIGPSPVALALDSEGKRLFVANAGENCIAVVDVSKPGRAKVKGFVPTERYPSAVVLTPDGKRLLVGTAKGFYGPNAGKNVTLGPKVPRPAERITTRRSTTSATSSRAD